MNIYDIRRYGTAVFIAISVAVVCVFLYFSGSLVNDLSVQERARMQIWADATKEIVSSGGTEGADMDFLLSIIEGNTNIPVLLTDTDGNIIMQRNFTLPVVDTDDPMSITENTDYLQRKLVDLKTSDNVIVIDIAPGDRQYLYYEDSTLLRNLSRYPYIQLLVMVAFVIIVYISVSSSKRAEQNKVWVGLSKETAHQLGTPISSLMAWVELLRENPETDPDMVAEMDKDVRRLSTIASRFSKIGSKPSMEPDDLNTVVEHSAVYMSGRISHHISIKVFPAGNPLIVNMSAPLLEWVMENLIKNAVDAMEGRGAITITLTKQGNFAVVEVTDTGRGMTRRQRKTVFNPGYTTKKRGWGLGLTLARRIIKQYHGGNITVSASEPGVGTTFFIQLPLYK